jgi:glutamate/tyrosine decarboxylase-like PLP-dependent enzyme
VKAHFDGPPPIEPEPPEEVYREYIRYIQPHQIGSAHPRFWGWVAGSGTVMGALAEFLAATEDAASGVFSFLSNNYVELQVLDWCKSLLGYPSAASGLLTSGCSASNLIGLAVARHAKAGFDVRSGGVWGGPQRMIVYCSEESHSSIQKAVELLGLGSESLRKVPVNESLQIDLADLRTAIGEDRARGFRPICVVGVAGTTNTGAIDDLQGLADVCEAEGLWFHVDGAFGAWAAIAPRHRHLVAGMERADSLAFDLHKWMYLNYPIGCVLVRNAEDHRRAFSLTPTYLAHGEGSRGLTGQDVPWLSDLGFELSRGFQALKAWMTFKEHGAAKYGRLIQQNIDQAHYLAALVEKSPELELALPVSLNVVCFRFTPPLRRYGRRSRTRIEVSSGAGIAIPPLSCRARNAARCNHESSQPPEDFNCLVGKSSNRTRRGSCDGRSGPWVMSLYERHLPSVDPGTPGVRQVRFIDYKHSTDELRRRLRGRFEEVDDFPALGSFRRRIWSLVRTCSGKWPIKILRNPVVSCGI